MLLRALQLYYNDEAHTIDLFRNTKPYRKKVANENRLKIEVYFDWLVFITIQQML